MTYFDIHNHILPGVDDGAENMEEALRMLEAAYKEGVRDMVLTPHYMRGKKKCERERLAEVFEMLKKESRERYPELTLYLGSEILYEEGIIEDIKNGLVQTMNDTKYVLVEFRVGISYNELYQAVRRLTNARFRPIIAHVERYRCLYKRMERIDELIGLEAYLQMNVSSLYGGMLDENSRWCRRLISGEYISFLATDAHDLEERGPYIKDYIGWLQKKCGEDLLSRLFQINPQKIVRNQYIID